MRLFSSKFDKSFYVIGIKAIISALQMEKQDWNPNSGIQEPALSTTQNLF